MLLPQLEVTFILRKSEDLRFLTRIIRASNKLPRGRDTGVLIEICFENKIVSYPEGQEIKLIDYCHEIK